MESHLEQIISEVLRRGGGRAPKTEVVKDYKFVPVFNDEGTRVVFPPGNVVYKDAKTWAESLGHDVDDIIDGTK